MTPEELNKQLAQKEQELDDLRKIAARMAPPPWWECPPFDTVIKYTLGFVAACIANIIFWNWLVEPYAWILRIFM